MENTPLRRKDTTRGPPLRVLSLDGGGVRGYSMLIILQELMYRAYVECEGKAPSKNQIPKPCDYFDLIVGNGTGGLIAIMLGRLRLDLETCKDVYVRMTKRVFETDKTIAGIPYRSTLFKASKLEDAIRECVREHTIFEDEGNDGISWGGADMATPHSPASIMSAPVIPQRSMSTASRASGFSPLSQRGGVGTMRWGNPDASLYDNRENRTKTAVTCVFKGTPKGGPSVMLRSYDSRKEPPPDYNCKIWQAGRATSAALLAFKPIQIGQNIYLDEGAGKYNPAPQVLDEATVNEWPGREVGAFVSIGTGKRPGGTNAQQHEWWEGFVGGAMGDFAEARRRLMTKIEGCEDTHQYMLSEHLAKRGVPRENYFRLNVEVGVGEFGMNEWNRLSDMNTGTRRYLAKPEVQKINYEAAVKMARIERARRRIASHELDSVERPPSSYTTPSNPMAVELPGEALPPTHSRLSQQYRPPQYPGNPQHPYYQQVSSSQDKFAVISSDEYPQTLDPSTPPRRSFDNRQSYVLGDDACMMPSPRRSGEDMDRNTPPPLPPKTPIQSPSVPMNQNFPRPARAQTGHKQLPYPDTDGPPPIVNIARKPEYINR